MLLERSSSNASTIADELVHAHRSDRLISIASLPTLADMNGAMAVQALVREQLDLPVAGWKVANGPANTPIAAPLLDVRTTGAEIALFPGCKIEVELAVRLKSDLPPKQRGEYSRSDMIDAISEVILGIEIVGGRLAEADPPFLSFLADNLGNRAYVAGARVPLAVLDAAAGGYMCAVTLNDQPLHEARSFHPSLDPLAPLLNYANAQNDCIGGLRAGQIVTTGSLCGVIPVEAPGILKGRLDGVGEVSVLFG
jgi:2-keto-4-pentenoate hydratase